MFYVYMCFKATLSQYFMMKNLKHSVKLKEKSKGISYAHHLDFTIIILLSLLYHLLTHISIPLSRGASPLFIKEFWLLHIFAKIWCYRFNFNHFTVLILTTLLGVFDGTQGF